MSASTFKAILRWVLLSLCTLHSTLVVGQMTSSVPTDYTFPSELPIGTNALSKMRANVKNVTVWTRCPYQIDGVLYNVLPTQKAVMVEIPGNSDFQDPAVLLKAAAVANELTARSAELLGEKVTDPEQLMYTFAWTIVQAEDANGQPLFVAQVYRALIRNAGTLKFEAQGEFSPEDLELKPATDYGTFSFGLPKGLVSAMSLDAVAFDATNVEDPGDVYTESSVSDTSEQRQLFTYGDRVVVPSRYIDGSYKGWMYIRIFNPGLGLPNRLASQIIAVDLQTGKIDRPQISFRKLTIRPVNVIGLENKIEVRPAYDVPRGTAFDVYSSESIENPVWKFQVRGLPGMGDKAPNSEFEVGLLVDKGPVGFFKVLVDDSRYPAAVRKALPPPQ